MEVYGLYGDKDVLTGIREQCGEGDTVTRELACKHPCMGAGEDESCRCNEEEEYGWGGFLACLHDMSMPWIGGGWQLWFLTDMPVMLCGVWFVDKNKGFLIPRS